MKIVSVKQVQAIEKSADSKGIRYDQMMYNAGTGISHWILENVSVQNGVIGLVGSGNNGGDTLIALTDLSKHGVRTTAFLAKKREDDPLLENYIKFGGEVVNIFLKAKINHLNAALIPGVILLDGILGTGLRLPLRGDLLDIMTRIHKLAENRPETLKIAVDCPSGIDCDTGEVSDVTLSASHTLTMAAVKQGLLKHPARSYAGNLHCIDIGIGDPSEHLSVDFPEMLDESFVNENLPSRPDTGHKGTFGTCLVLAGCESYTGAAYLAGKAAYLAGSGLVRIATQEVVQRCIAGELAEAVWTILPRDNDSYHPNGAALLEKELVKVDSLVLGPGWGVSETNADFLINLLGAIPPALPTLIDADALKLLSQIDHWTELLPENVVFTPHPGEMSVLTGLDVGNIQSNRWEIAKKYAERWGVNLVLKGSMTVVAAPGHKVFINPISDSALATAGSGDVLSGIIGGLMGQHIPALEAAAMGVWLHGRTGVEARMKLGTEVSVTAKDLLDNIYVGFRRCNDCEMY
jgi:NAD(P)H-hydrate epimerase